MNKRILGRTGLEVSEIGMGGIPIQRVDSDTATEILNKALDSGINFIDTARLYTDSEIKIGDALSSRRNEFFIATKTTKKTRDEAIKEIEISLKDLKTDKIDLYQIHNVKDAEDLDKRCGKGGILEALKEAKEKGQIGFIGVTSHKSDVLMKALDKNVFDTVQVPFNAIEQEAIPLFERCKKENIGVIIMKPLGGGALDANFSIRFILEHDVSVVIPGMQSVNEIEENVKAIDKLSDLEREKLLADAKSLGKTFCRRCGYCMPCPQGIDILGTLLFDTYYTRYNLKEWSCDRYAEFDIKANKCIECGVCESKCPYNLPIRDMLKTSHKHLSSKGEDKK